MINQGRGAPVACGSGGAWDLARVEGYHCKSGQGPLSPGRSLMQKLRILGLLLPLAGTCALADDMKPPINAAQLKWAPAPDFFHKAAQIAVLSGDPSKEGLYVVRLKLPAGYKVPAHNHPTAEMLTVISGNFHLGMGDKLDEKKAVELTAGGYAEAPA